MKVRVFHGLGLALIAASLFLNTEGLTAQSSCARYGGELTTSVEPSTPLVFSFFPISLMGIGDQTSAGALESFQSFGVRFSNTGAVEREVNLAIYLYSGTEAVFSQEMAVTMAIPVGTYFVSVPQLISGNISGGLNPRALIKPTINSTFRNRFAGGVPSGSFRFEVRIAEENQNTTDPSTICGSIFVEVLSGATVDIVVPSNGTQTGSLPLFQWSAVGGSKFRLTFAKLKPNQSYEDALATSSQRVVLEVRDVNSYQATAGGPSGAIENNLTWNPGLQDGDYCVRVTMIQEDPLTGATNEVTSAINSFVVASGTAAATVGLNATEVLSLLASVPGLSAILEQLRGYNPVLIEINGTVMTVEDLRNKLANLPGTYKVKLTP